MLDKKIKLRGVIFFCIAISFPISIWSSAYTGGCDISSSFKKFSIGMTIIILLLDAITCFLSVYQLREEWKLLTIILLVLSSIIALFNLLIAFIIPMAASHFIPLTLGLCAFLEAIVAVSAASVLLFYFGRRIPTDRWCCNSHP